LPRPFRRPTQKTRPSSRASRTYRLRVARLARVAEISAPLALREGDDHLGERGVPEPLQQGFAPIRVSTAAPLAFNPAETVGREV
jgi:hypothetical protein